MDDSGTTLPWIDEIRKKLTDLYQDNVETLTRVLFYLDQEDLTYKDDERVLPVWKVLRSCLFSNKIFERYASRLAEDTKRTEMDEKYRNTMRILYDQLLDATDSPLDEDHNQGFVLELDIIKKSGFIGLSRIWSMISKASQLQIVQIIPKIVTKKAAVTDVDEVVRLVYKSEGATAEDTLAAAHLPYDILRNLYRWWNDEISGVRCGKSILDNFYTISAAVGGSVYGAFMGSLLGPAGIHVGTCVGVIMPSATMKVLNDRITHRLFGVPKYEALENAYDYLGVKMTASNHETNTAFRHLCLKHHPDKGGSSYEFHFLQLNMGVIKAAKGELYN